MRRNTLLASFFPGYLRLGLVVAAKDAGLATHGKYPREYTLNEALNPFSSPGDVNAPASALGRVLFERVHPQSYCMTLWACGCGVLLLAAAGIALALLNLDEFVELLPDSALLLVMPLSSGVILVLFAVDAWRFKLRFHEFGVSKSGLLRTRHLRFEDVSSFAFNSSPRSGLRRMNYTVSFSPDPRTGADSFYFTITLNGAVHEDMDWLREHLSKMIAAGMAEELKRGKVVVWTPSLTLLPTALESRSPDRGEVLQIPYQEIIKLEINAGHLSLMSQRSPFFVQANTLLPNFFPGYVLLGQLVEAARGQV